MWVYCFEFGVLVLVDLVLVYFCVCVACYELFAYILFVACLRLCVGDLWLWFVWLASVDCGVFMADFALQVTAWFCLVWMCTLGYCLLMFIMFWVAVLRCFLWIILCGMSLYVAWLQSLVLFVVLRLGLLGLMRGCGLIVDLFLGFTLFDAICLLARLVDLFSF